MESRNVVITEMSSRLLPPPTEESSVQVPGNEEVSGDNIHNYATEDDFLRDLSRVQLNDISDPRPLN